MKKRLKKINEAISFQEDHYPFDEYTKNVKNRINLLEGGFRFTLSEELQFIIDNLEHYNFNLINEYSLYIGLNSSYFASISDNNQHSCWFRIDINDISNYNTVGFGSNFVNDLYDELMENYININDHKNLEKVFLNIKEQYLKLEKNLYKIKE